MLKSDRIHLRKFKVKDINDLYEYTSNKEVCESAGWYYNEFKEEAIQMVLMFMLQRCVYAIVETTSNKVIGHISFRTRGKDTTVKELGYMLHESYQNKGYMSEAVNLLLEYLFTTKVTKVYACCAIDNPASQRVIQKNHFVFEKEETFESRSLNKTFQTLAYYITKEMYQE